MNIFTKNLAAGGLEAEQLKLSNLNNSGLAALSFIGKLNLTNL